jgi:hypothetical protein
MKTVWIVAAVILVALSCLAALTIFERSDESWFLRVLERVNTGETLYRDVYYPLLPLAVYVGAAVTAVFGASFLVLQALFFACFVATVWVCDSIARQLKIRPIARALLLVALCVWSSPTAIHHITSLYQPLSTLLLLLCVRMVLAWSLSTSKKGGNISLALASIAAGAAFATKDQIGAVALVALLVSVAIVAVHRKLPRTQLLRTSIAIVAVFIGIVLLTLVPVILSGTFGQLAEYFIVERQGFSTAYVSYLEGVGQFFRSVIALDFIRNPMEAMRYSLFLVSPAVVGLLLVTAVRLRGEDRIVAAILLAFSGGAFLTAFPRSDFPHIVLISAMIIVGLVYVIDRLFVLTPLRNAIVAILFLSLGVGFAEAIWASAARIVVMDYGFVRLPHFEYAMARSSEIESWRRDRDALVGVAEKGPLLFVTYDAGFLYLITGIKNPTSIDYPAVVSMGRDGEEKIIRLIQSRQIDFVCFRPYPDPGLRALQLQTFIETKMQLMSELAVCDLYKMADTD